MPELNARDLVHELTRDFVDQTWHPVVYDFVNFQFYYVEGIRVIDGRLEIELGERAPIFPDKEV
jgi:hypothetical protein